MSDEQKKSLLAIWSGVLAFPFQLAAILGLLRLIRDTQPYQLGLTTHRLSKNIALGMLGWLALQAPVLAIHTLATVVYRLLTDAPPEPHILERLAHPDSPAIDWAVLVLTAVVVAPVMEELLCRGILQPWAMHRPYGGDVVMALALLAALAHHGGEMSRSFEKHDWRALAASLQPAAFVVIAVPGYLWLRYWRQSQVGGGIFATALFFGSIHSNWPSPVALFFLGLGLGWLAYRTQSLIGAMTLHALFNAFAFLTLVLTQGEPAPAPSNGKATTEASRFSESAATWTAVPGSQEPRRR
jgi:membrane protease YdiL (CAAX protease family)